MRAWLFQGSAGQGDHQNWFSERHEALCVPSAHTSMFTTPPPSSTHITEETILSYKTQTQRTCWVAGTSNHSSRSIIMGPFSIKRKKKSSNYPGRYMRLPVSTFSLMPATLNIWSYVFWFCFEKNVRILSREAKAFIKELEGLPLSFCSTKFINPCELCGFSSDSAVPDGSISRSSLSRLDWLCDWSYMLVFQGNFPMEKFSLKVAGVCTLLT